MPRLKPFGAICQPFNSSSRANDGLEFICCVGRQHPQIHEVWTFADDGITYKFHPFARVDVGNFSGECFGTNYFAEMDTDCTCTAENILMGVSSGSAFFALVAMMNFLGLKISYVPICVGDTDAMLKIGHGGVNLAVTTSALTSFGVEPSLPVRLTLTGVRKMRAPLLDASVTLSFGNTVWGAPKVS